MSRIDLDLYASSCIEVAIYGMETLDIEGLRDNAQDAISEEAESACVYTANCRDIIGDYESEADQAGIADISSGRTFKAEDWQQAMVAYAYNVAYCVISTKVYDLLSEIEDAADALETTADNSGCEDTGAPLISSNCPHGWAAHDREDDDGVRYWGPSELEGCRAVAVKVSGWWLSYTWTPGGEG